MNHINSIIDYNKHPINDVKYIQECNLLIKKNRLFISPKILVIQDLKVEVSGVEPTNKRRIQNISQPTCWLAIFLTSPMISWLSSGNRSCVISCRRSKANVDSFSHVPRTNMIKSIIGMMANNEKNAIDAFIATN